MQQSTLDNLANLARMTLARPLLPALQPMFQTQHRADNAMQQHQCSGKYGSARCRITLGACFGLLGCSQCQCNGQSTSTSAPVKHAKQRLRAPVPARRTLTVLAKGPAKSACPQKNSEAGTPRTRARRDCVQGHSQRAHTYRGAAAALAVAAHKAFSSSRASSTGRLPRAAVLS